MRRPAEQRPPTARGPRVESECGPGPGWVAASGGRTCSSLKGNRDSSHCLTRPTLGPAEARGSPMGRAQPPGGAPGLWLGRSQRQALSLLQAPGPGPPLSLAAAASVGGGGLLQAQQLPHQSLAKLSPAVPLHVVGIRHLVEDVGVVDGDADGEPEHLLPGLVRFMRDEIPTRTEESERLTLGLTGTRGGAGGAWSQRASSRSVLPQSPGVGSWPGAGSRRGCHSELT